MLSRKNDQFRLISFIAAAPAYEKLSLPWDLDPYLPSLVTPSSEPAATPNIIS